jgi:putative endonuclease
MHSSGKQLAQTAGGGGRPDGKQVTTKAQGDQAEVLARAFLQRQGMRWLASKFRSPGRGGGEIDLIMRDADGTLVFVEVRQRSRNDFGGAAASIVGSKRSRIIFAAQHYLLRLSSPPPCRFDVVLIEGPLQADPTVTWHKAAFDAS